MHRCKSPNHRPAAWGRKDILLHNVAQSMKLSLNGTDLKKGAVVHDGQDAE